MNVKQITKTTMTRTLTTIVGSLFVLLLAAAPALAQTGTLQGKALYLYDGGSAANLNRIGLFTPADADLTTTYNLLLPKTQGAQNDILYVESTAGPVTTLQFTNGNGLFWRLLGNTSTTPWNGTSGNFLGTADAQNLVIRAGGANTIEFWNGTTSANRWTIPAAGGLTQGGDNSQVTFTGNVDATNGLDVTNADLTVGGTRFTVDDATGNTHTDGDLDVDGNTTLGDAATDSHTILGVTTINGGTSTAATTIGNAAGGHVTLAVNPGTTNLVFNGIVQAVPTGTDDLLWIQSSAGNEVRRTNIGGLVDEGLQYDNGKIRLGANAVDVNPIVSSRTATIGTGGTLTFSTTGGSNTMLVLNNNGNVGISTVGTGTTTIGNGSAGAISVTGGSTIGLTAGSTATVTAGSGNIDLNATTLDVNITAGTNVDVASATTNINTGTGNVNIGNAAGTNTILGTTNADGNTTINDGVNAFTTNIGTGGNTGAVTVGNTGNTVSILGGTNTITGTTTINTGGSATTTIGNIGSGGAVGIAANANITVDPGATSNNLVLNNIQNLTPITDLLWIDGSNNVRRASFTTTANEGVDFDNGAYRLGSLTANTGKPIVNPRFVNVGTGGTLTFTTATVGDQMLVLNNNGNVGISTAGSGTTTIGSAAAGAISAQSASTIGLTAGTTFDVASATTNINTGSGNVNIGNSSNTVVIAGGTNTVTGTQNSITGTTNLITGTTNINTIGGSHTTIGHNDAGAGTVTINAGTVNAPNLPGGAATDNVVTVDGSGNLRKTSVATMLGSGAWVNGGNSFGATGTLGTNDANHLEIETDGVTRWRVPSGGGLKQGPDAQPVAFTGQVLATHDDNKIGSNTSATQLTIDGVADASITETMIGQPAKWDVIVDGDFGVKGTTVFNDGLWVNGSLDIGGGNYLAVITSAGVGLGVGTASAHSLYLGTNQRMDWEVPASGGLTQLTNHPVTLIGTTSITAETNINTSGANHTRIGTGTNTGAVIIGNNDAGGAPGNTVDIAAPVVNVSNIPAGAYGDNLVTINGSGQLGKASISTMLGSGVWFNGGNSFGAAGTIGTLDNYGLNINTNGTPRITISNTGTTTIAGETNINTSGTATTNLGTGTNSGTVTIGNTANKILLGGIAAVKAGTAQTPAVNTQLNAFDASKITVTVASTANTDYITMPAGTEDGQLVCLILKNTSATYSLEIRNNNNAVLGAYTAGQTALLTAMWDATDTKWYIISLVGQP